MKNYGFQLLLTNPSLFSSEPSSKIYTNDKEEPLILEKCTKRRMVLALEELQ